jgi:hypothetical protein
MERQKKRNKGGDKHANMFEREKTNEVGGGGAKLLAHLTMKYN